MPSSTMTNPRSPASPFAPSREQVATLSAAANWWREGERRLDYLAERATLQGFLAQAETARNGFRAATAPVAADAVPLLRLARALAPNVALNRDRETDDFSASLHALLFGNDPLADRIGAFLASVRGAGVATASHLLFAAYPDRYPLVTRDTAAFVPPTPEQKRAAKAEAITRFGAGGDAQAVALLTAFVWQDALRVAAGLPDFADLWLILRHAGEMPAPPKKRGKANTVKEGAAARYAASSPEPTEADVLRYLEAFAASQGLTYPPLALRNYYLCHKTKPFVILAGLSGTGKTRLTELFADAVSGAVRSRYRLLPVRPDWADPSPLLGYHNALTSQYIGTPFLELLRDAARAENRDRAYFVALDEMNLARAEHYLADVLSAMETRTGEITLSGTFDTVRLSDNVFLSGTVNIEEGTHPFGAKVLDRANVIEFGAVRFAPGSASAPQVLPEIAPGDRERLFLGNRLTGVADAEARLSAASPTFLARFYETLTALSDLLEPRGFAFGYRVRDESLRYVAHAFAPDGSPLLVDGGMGLENLSAALDLQLVQKVLPRLSGTQERFGGFLQTLADWATTQDFKRTADKLRRMNRHADDDGMVSFWE
ncbi:MAG: hypothetical protein H7Y38_12660 [Armatimonadetes bacterium]|nr:hypothetical protein [Armatimonadota bacterium]